MKVANITYCYSIKVGITEMVKEKINKSTVVVCEVLKPIEILTIIKYSQFLLETCIAVDTCMHGKQQNLMSFAIAAVNYNSKVIITMK